MSGVGFYTQRRVALISRIATAAIYVQDQQKAVRFWTERVGFDVHREAEMGPNAKWIEVGPSGAESNLVLYPRTMMKDWAERKPSIVFQCKDIRATFEEMSARGVRFTQEPQAMAWGLFAIFNDEDGNWYGLRQAG